MANKQQRSYIFQILLGFKRCYEPKYNSGFHFDSKKIAHKKIYLLWILFNTFRRVINFHVLQIFFATFKYFENRKKCNLKAIYKRAFILAILSHWNDKLVDAF